MSAAAAASISAVRVSTKKDPPKGSGVAVTPLSCAMICCVRSAIVAAVSVGKRQRFIKAVGVQALCAAEHRGQRLNGYANDVVLRLLCRQRRTAGLRVEPEHLCLWIRGAKFLRDVGPHAAGRPEFGYFLKEIIVRIKEEGKPLSEHIDVQSYFKGCFQIRFAVGQCKRQFLYGCGAGLAYVVTGNGNRIPAGNMLARNRRRCL